MARRDPQAFNLDASSGGAYRLAQGGTLVGAQAATPASVFSCRWTSATLLAVIERVRLSWVQTVGFTNPVAFVFFANVARSYTVTDTGGTSVINNIVKQRTSFPASAFGDMRVANSAAAGITAGTRTLDSGSFLFLPIVPSTAIGTQPPPPQNSVDFDPNKYPLVLAQNEGLVVQLNVAFPAAAGGSFIVEMDWTEVAAF